MCPFPQTRDGWESNTFTSQRACVLHHNSLPLPAAEDDGWAQWGEGGTEVGGTAMGEGGRDGAP